MKSNITKTTKQVELKEDTWQKAWELKLKYRKRSLDETIHISLAIFEIISVIAEEHNQDPVLLTKDMALWYDEYLKKRWKYEKRRAL